MDKKIKHLEFIQGVINRLSQNSFLLKGWSVVLVSAFFALSTGDSNPVFVYLTFIPIVIFWGIDAYFLYEEKRYRKLYDNVRLLDEEKVDFSMSIKEIEGVSYWWGAFFSKTLIPFHGILLIAVVLVLIIGLI